jgi:DNA repair photolyase
MSIYRRGRGSGSNSTGRFESVNLELDPIDPQDVENTSPLRTQFFKDTSRSIVTKNTSPDIGFTYSMNFYRGCEHGCAYCYARPTHEYLGMSAGLDFETKIFVKENAPELLREELMSSSWQPDVIHIAGITDCYQPAERKFQLTRRVLQVLAEFRNPVSLITKNALITRDIDILQELAANDLVIAYLSVTSLDTELARDLEPRTSTPSARLNAVEQLAKAGIPVGVNVAPVIPGLTDHEMPKILKAAKDAGADFAGYTALRLPYSVSAIFEEWLENHRPLAKAKVLHQIREMRGGKLNDPEFGSRMRGTGPKAKNMNTMFKLFTKQLGLNQREHALRTDLFQRPGDQLSLF